MPSFTIDSSTVRGAIFDHPEVLTDRFLDQAKAAIAQAGENLVSARLAHVLKNPTGYYESRIRTDRSMDDYVVHDSRVVYGPWLEGTGSMNFPVTRFPGYRTFRIVRQQLEAHIDRIINKEVRLYLRSLND